MIFYQLKKLPDIDIMIGRIKNLNRIRIYYEYFIFFKAQGGMYLCI